MACVENPLVPLLQDQDPCFTLFHRRAFPPTGKTVETELIALVEMSCRRKVAAPPRVSTFDGSCDSKFLTISQRFASAICCTCAAVCPSKRPNFDADSAESYRQGLAGVSSCQGMLVMGNAYPTLGNQKTIPDRHRSTTTRIRIWILKRSRTGIPARGKCQAAGACGAIVRPRAPECRRPEVAAGRDDAIPPAVDLSEIDSHTATTIMIADVRTDSISGDSSAGEPGERAQRNDADPVRELKEAAKAVLEQDRSDQEQQRSADRAQNRPDSRRRYSSARVSSESSCSAFAKVAAGCSYWRASASA